MTQKEPMKADCYSRFTTGALVRLLNHACGASAIHRGIREELCRRLALTAKTKPSEQPLLFTGAEWSAIKRGGVKRALQKVNVVSREC
jgi:hypothetical protein